MQIRIKTLTNMLTNLYTIVLSSCYNYRICMMEEKECAVQCLSKFYANYSPFAARKMIVGFRVNYQPVLTALFCF